MRSLVQICLTSGKEGSDILKSEAVVSSRSLGSIGMPAMIIVSPEENPFLLWLGIPHSTSTRVTPQRSADSGHSLGAQNWVRIVQ